jgi:hypothetical protein
MSSDPVAVGFVGARVTARSETRGAPFQAVWHAASHSVPAPGHSQAGDERRRLIVPVRHEQNSPGRPGVARSGCDDWRTAADLVG